MFFLHIKVFSFGRVVLYTVFMVFPLPQTLVKTLAKNLVKNLAKNLGGNLFFLHRFWEHFDIFLNNFALIVYHIFGQVFDLIFGQVFDQVFDQGFDQVPGEGKKHKYSVQYYWDGKIQCTVLLGRKNLLRRLI